MRSLAILTTLVLWAYPSVAQTVPVSNLCQSSDRDYILDESESHLGPTSPTFTSGDRTVLTCNFYISQTYTIVAGDPWSPIRGQRRVTTGQL